MKKSIFFIISILMLLGITGYSQDNPKRSDGAAWLYGTYSPKANFFDLHKLGLDYFKVYKDSDNTYELYNRFKVWSDIFGSRSVWADSPQDGMAGVYKETADLNAAAITLPPSHPYSDWKQTGASESPVQNLGTVTSIWQDPANPDNYMIGTEASGIWQFNSSTQTWKNISDTYTGALTGFGVSSLDKHGTQLMAASFNPSMDMFIGEGIGLLFTTNNGATWSQLLPTYMTNNSFLTSEVIWKVLKDKRNLGSYPNDWLIAKGDTVYSVNALSQASFFNNARKIGVPHNNDSTWLQSRIRDFELSDTLYRDSVTRNYHALCFSTDGFYRENIRQNAELFYQFRNNTHFFSGKPSQITLPYDNVHNFIEYIAIDQYKTTNPNNLFYVVYKEVSMTDPTTSWLHIGVLKKNVNYVNDSTLLTYQEYSTTPVANNFNSAFAGFGYRYNAFKVAEKNQIYYMLIGGYYVTIISFDPPTNTIISTPYISSPGLSGPSESPTYNDKCHYGIRDIASKYYSTLNEPKILIGNEGGISDISFKSGLPVYSNVNYKGLAIAQVRNLSSSKYSATNVLVHSSYRNGYWSKACIYPWHSTAFMDGGSSKIVDEQLGYNSYTQGFANSPTNYFGITNNELYYNPSQNYYPDQMYFSSNAWLYDQGYCATPQKTPLLTTDFGNPWWTQPCTYAAPLAIRPDTANLFYLAHHDIYQTNNLDGFSWSRISFPAYGYPSLSHWAWSLQALEFAPSSKDTLFAIFPVRTEGRNEAGQGNNYPAGHKIYRGVQINNIWHWQDLTTDSLPYIFHARGLTDIAVNPDNSKELWITLDQYSGHIMNGEYRVMHTTDGGLSWDDYSTGLSCVPVNSIVLNRESNLHDLYVANDMGVFYRNDTMSSWKPYMQNLPRCMVMDLEIDYDRMVLYAGTWGRSVWESRIPCYNEMPQDITVSSNQTWSTPKYNCGNITVNSGATLTVSTTVEMGIGKEIRVKPGATLSLVNATVTNSCKRYWKGIVVEGDHNLSIFYNSSQHGKLFSSGSTISNALLAVRTQSIDTTLSTNHGGGEVSCYNTLFLNNRLSVKMKPYINRNPNNHTPYYDLSTFNNCNFVYNEDYIIDSLFIGFVDIDGINRVQFNGCAFRNDYAPCGAKLENIGTGIKAHNSTFVAQSTYSGSYPGDLGTITPCEFKNLSYGVWTKSDTGTVVEAKVIDSKFTGNTHGIYAYNNKYNTFLSNIFHVPPKIQSLWDTLSGQPYGVYTQCWQTLKFEGNIFRPCVDSASGYIGVLAVNTGENPNKIYNCSFDSIRYGVIALGNNRANDASGFVNKGLVMKCNDFSNCYFDIAARKLNLTAPTPASEGIASAQGNNPGAVTGAAAMQFTANNRFSHSCTTGNNDLFNDARSFKYVYWIDTASTPSCYSMNLITTLGVTNGSPFDKPFACPPVAIQPPPSQPFSMDAITQLNTLSTQLNSQTLLYKMYVDGGNTQALKDAIELAYPWESYDQFNQLMELSPYVSDEVLIAAAANEELFPAPMIRLILLANPQGLRSDDVWKALENRINPIPEETMAELENATGNYSPKDKMESELSILYAQKQNARARLYDAFAYEGEAWIADSLLASYRKDKDYTFLPVMMGINQKLLRYDDIDALFTFFLQECTLSSGAEAEVLAFKTMYLMQRNWVNNAVTGEELMKLQDFMQDSNYKVVETAIALYSLAVPDYQLKEIIRLPYEQPREKSKRFRAIHKPQAKPLQASPNPAHDFITVSYQLPDDVSEATLCIYDATGRKYYCKAADKSGNTIIGLDGLVKGIYICTLETNGSVLQSVKFSVY